MDLTAAAHPHESPPLVGGSHDFGTVTDRVCEISEWKTPKAWYVAFGISVATMLMLLGMIAYLAVSGLGVWGLNMPVAWGFAIVNFVFWVSTLR